MLGNNLKFGQKIAHSCIIGSLIATSLSVVAELPPAASSSSNTCELASAVTSAPPSGPSLSVALRFVEKDSQNLNQREQNALFAWLVSRTGHLLKTPSPTQMGQKTKIELGFPAVLQGQLIFIEATYVVHLAHSLQMNDRTYESPAQAVLDELNLVVPSGERYPLAKTLFQGSHDKIVLQTLQELPHVVTLSSLFPSLNLNEAITTEVEIPKFIRGERVLKNYFNFMKDYFRQDGVFWSNQFLHDLGDLTRIKTYADVQWAWQKVRAKNGFYWFGRALTSRVPWFLFGGALGLGSYIWQHFQPIPTPEPPTPNTEMVKVIENTNSLLRQRNEQLIYQGKSYPFEVALDHKFRILLKPLSEEFPETAPGEVEFTTPQGGTVHVDRLGSGEMVLQAD